MARILIASGGTGGHFYPGFSLGQALRERGHELLYLVRKDDPALPLLEKSGFPAQTLDLRGLPRTPTLQFFPFFWKLGGSFARLQGLLSSRKPHAVVGMGSYLSFPAVFSAWTRRVPCLIHESNTSLGLANRLSVPFVKKVCFGLPSGAGAGAAGSKSILTGTPIREALWGPADPENAKKTLGLAAGMKTVLVLGGSQGARRMNAVFPTALAAAGRATGGVQVLHLTGAHHRGAVEELYRVLGLPAVVLEYLERMELAYAAADLAVCRAGASTLAELIARKKPSLLVPFPHASARHQSENARLFESAGAAVRLEEEDLTEDSAASLLTRLLSQQGELIRTDMALALERLKIPVGRAAVEALVHAVEEILPKPS